MGGKISAFKLAWNPELQDQYLTYHAIGAQKTFRIKLCILDLKSNIAVQICNKNKYIFNQKTSKEKCPSQV